ncbi:NAD(P)H-dependent oxidoreductase [Sporichthya brevicatena]|uniref:NAD(P)H-dependent oxidoreductase n=1 Tax=Sporichthya brevicatena TaxID=171442 RepID=A0ABN1GUY6_9ACTN
MPRTLIVIGHPFTETLNHALAAEYEAGLREGGHSVRVIDLAQATLATSPAGRTALRPGPDGQTDHLSDEVRAMIDDVLWAEHLVFFHPQWWGTYPGVLKTFVDQVFLAGIAFRMESGPMPVRLLRGRTARLVMTMDSPSFWNRFAYRNAAETSLKRAILGYCGVRTVGITRFTPVRKSTPEQRERWLQTARRLGRTDARKGGRPAPMVDAPSRSAA